MASPLMESLETLLICSYWLLFLSFYPSPPAFSSSPLYQSAEGAWTPHAPVSSLLSFLLLNFSLRRHRCYRSHFLWELKVYSKFHRRNPHLEDLCHKLFSLIWFSLSFSLTFETRLHPIIDCFGYFWKNASLLCTFSIHSNIVFSTLLACR